MPLLVAWNTVAEAGAPPCLEARLTRAEKVIAVPGKRLGALAAALPWERRSEVRALIAAGVDELVPVIGELDKFRAASGR